MAWKKMDKITIVYHHDGSPVAFVVETGNESQLNTAIAWTRSDTMPKMIETENKDFSFEIISSAGNSCNGGKLSFWMCRFEKEGIEPFYVGINASLLVNFIRESTLVNGKATEKVFFARQDGNLGVLHENMSEYRQFVEDQERREAVKNGKKTSKWQVGWSYKTLTDCGVFFGKYPKIANHDYTYSKQYKKYVYLTDLDFNAKEQFVITGYQDGTDFQTLITDLCEYIPYAFKEKCPARVVDKQVFVITEDYYEKLEKSLLVAAKYIFEHKPYYKERIAQVAFMFYYIKPQITIHILQLAVELFKKNTAEQTNRREYVKYNNYTYKCKDYKEYFNKLLEIAQERLKNEDN